MLFVLLSFFANNLSPAVAFFSTTFRFLGNIIQEFGKEKRKASIIFLVFVAVGSGLELGMLLVELHIKTII